MKPSSQPARIMIVAGEASGDHHGAALVRAMRSVTPDLRIQGIGGAAMAEAGVDVKVPAEQLAVVGITEVLTKTTHILRGLSAARRMLRTFRPHLLILIDFPDFNFQVAAAAKTLNIPILYYISPQIWAWRAGRVHTIGRLVDHMAVILPFEAEFYRRHRIPVSFVGHPLMDKPIEPGSNREWSQADSRPVIGLLPGSRDKEVASHLPALIEAANELRKNLPGARFVVSLAPSVNRQPLGDLLAAIDRSGISVDSGSIQAILAQSHLVVAASGTVTLEAAIAGTPMIIIYRVSPLSYRLGKAFIKVDHVGLANLIAGRRVVPELLQHEVNGSRIADAAYSLLSRPERLAAIRRQLKMVRKRLGRPGAAQRTAALAFRLMDRRQ